MYSRSLSLRRELLLAIFSFALFMPFSFSYATTSATVGSPYLYTFNSAGTLIEAGSMTDSSSGYWWINSGAKLVIANSVGGTVHNSLSATDPWRVLYNSTSPTDTDAGYHPQNLFRLVSRSTWNNAHVESQFKIDKDNFSASPNRNASNGLLLMLRYVIGGQTLYYAGIRVDGYAVLKKKINGIYYTMATKKVFPGTYSVASNVNLLPHNAWITIGADTLTNADGSVTVNLKYTAPGATSSTVLLTSTDSGQFGGSAPITAAGYVGIRTDFMDVSFDNFKAIAI